MFRPYKLMSRLTVFILSRDEAPDASVVVGGDFTGQVGVHALPDFLL